MSGDLERVQFITTEFGDDLIVSFFVARSQDPSAGRSITLMRDRKWEHLVADEDKGVTLSDEDAAEPEQVEGSRLKAVRIDDRVAEIATKRRRYQLDLRDVDDTDLKAAKKILRKMNHDSRFKLAIN